MQEVQTNVKQGAVIGGWACFGLGLLFMAMSLWTFIFYAPLFFAAFVLSIVAMSQRRVGGGLALLLCSVIIPPLTFFSLFAYRGHQRATEQPTGNTGGGISNLFSQSTPFESLPPVPAKRFNDYAGLTRASTQADLEERLTRFDNKSSVRVTVAVFRKMNSSESVEEHSYHIAKSWGLAPLIHDRNVILFVFVDDHKMRIEVGSDLQGILTNDKAKQILDRDLQPRFQQGDFDGGLNAAVNSIVTKIEHGEAPR